MGLRTNYKETKDIKTSSTQARRYFQNLAIGDFKFESGNSFTYLGSDVNNENKMWTFTTPKSLQQIKHTQHILNSSGPNSCPEILN
jgi:hypothetical protein